MSAFHKTSDEQKPRHKAEGFDEPPAKAVSKTPEEIHNEVLDCLNASQAGAVQERVNALMLKFPELQGAMQLPPEPIPPGEEIPTRRKK